MGEWLTRKSVGVAVKPHTRDELLALEKEKNEAKGFLKGYYNFMTRLTGKRSIESYNVKKDAAKPEVKPEIKESNLTTADYMAMIKASK